MTELVVTGLGTISPAGWSVAALRQAIALGTSLPAATLPRPGRSEPLAVRRVPAPPARPAFLAHPRLRRASPISQFTVAAALAALGHEPTQPVPPVPGADRLGLVFCTMTGSVLYSRRFFEEALRDPATASPLLFPETVFNAPASHLAAVLGLAGRVHTEVGDATCLPAALATVALWIQTGAVDRCLLVAAEEADWLPADGLVLRHRTAVAAEGAGALLFEPARGQPALARLEGVTDPVRHDPAVVRRQLALQGGPEERLVDDFGRGGPLHREAARVWADWKGTRCSPASILGEAWAAGAAWQCVEAVAAVAAGEARRAAVMVHGTHGQAIGVRFGEAPRPAS